MEQGNEQQPPTEAAPLFAAISPGILVSQQMKQLHFNKKKCSLK